MIACIDVGYHGLGGARAACVTFNAWYDSEPTGEYTVEIAEIAPYVPGKFYLRELPCVQHVLGELACNPDLIVVDGYVWLDPDGRKGLGAYVHEAFDATIPVIGIAKNRFRTASNAIKVLRGTSKDPLYVTAAGYDQELAAEHLQEMHGPNRIPTLLKRVDALSRT